MKKARMDKKVELLFFFVPVRLMNSYARIPLVVMK